MKMLWMSTFISFYPVIFLMPCHRWSRIFDFFSWWLFWFLYFRFFSLDSFENIIELLINRLIFWMKSSMFLNKIFTYLELFMNVCGDYILSMVHYLMWISPRVETLVDWQLYLDESGCEVLLSLGLLAV